VGSSVGLIVGIPVHYQAIQDAFVRTWVVSPRTIIARERSHLEDRYCSRTGQKLAPVKISDVPQQTQPAKMMVGIFYFQTEFQNFLQGFGNCLTCWESTREEWWKPCAEHLSCHQPPYIHAYLEGEDNDPTGELNSHYISETLVNFFNDTTIDNNGDDPKYSVTTHGDYCYFSCPMLDSQDIAATERRTDLYRQFDEAITLDAMEAAKPKLARLRELLIQAGIPAEKIIEPMAVPVFYE